MDGLYHRSDILLDGIGQTLQIDSILEIRAEQTVSVSYCMKRWRTVISSRCCCHCHNHVRR
jgi:hypothetical protein